MKENTFAKLTAFLSRLERCSIAYSLAHHRDDAIMVTVATPGERWEIEFLNDGSVEIERFNSNGEIHDEAMIDQLFERYSGSDVDDAAVAS